MADGGVCNLTLTQEWLTFQQQDTVAASYPRLPFVSTLSGASLGHQSHL